LLLGISIECFRLFFEVELGEFDWTEREWSRNLLTECFREIFRVIQVQVTILALDLHFLLCLFFFCGGLFLLTLSALLLLGFLGGSRGDSSLPVRSSTLDVIIGLLDLFCLLRDFLTALLHKLTHLLGHIGELLVRHDLIPSLVDPLRLELHLWRCTISVNRVSRWLDSRHWKFDPGVLTIESTCEEDHFFNGLGLGILIFIFFHSLGFILAFVLDTGFFLYLLDVIVVNRLVSVLILQTEPGLAEVSLLFLGLGVNSDRQQDHHVLVRFASLHKVTERQLNLTVIIDLEPIVTETFSVD